MFEIPLIIIFSLALIFFIIELICFFKTFYSAKQKPLKPGEYRTAPGEIYDPYRPQMIEWIKDLRSRPYEEFSIVSFDGLPLYGKYYECQKGAPIELMFHGYRGTAEQDLCGGVQRCFELGHNAFVVDQRGAGKSGGRTISFGINEHKDCLRWIDCIIDHFGKDVKIILTGISMGASTVLMASELPMPESVKGIVADCGYTSPKEIITCVAKSMHVPKIFVYPVGFMARIFGKFDYSYSTKQSLAKTNIPVIFIHGLADDFVPSYMTEQNYDACASRKMMHLVENATHGYSFLVDEEGVKSALEKFITENTVKE